MLNRVLLMGRIATDLELKKTNNDVSVVSFRIAVERGYVKQGEERQADFFDITAWRHTAEFVCKHFGKGSLIAIDGTLETRTYQANDGTNRTVVQVKADNAYFTGERKEKKAESSYQPAPENRPQPNFVPTTGTQQEFVDVDVDDDLPF